MSVGSASPAEIGRYIYFSWPICNVISVSGNEKKSVPVLKSVYGNGI